MGLEEGDFIIGKNGVRLGLIVGLDEGDCEMEGMSSKNESLSLSSCMMSPPENKDE